MIERHIFNEDSFDLYDWIAKGLYETEKLVFHNCKFSLLHGRSTVYLGGYLTFINCIFRGVNFSSRYGSANFNKCSFDDVVMKYDTYYDMSMIECTFENCVVRSCNFKRGFFKKLSLKSFSQCGYANTTFESISEIGEFNDFNSCKVKKSCFKFPRHYQKTCKACGLKTFTDLSLGKYCSSCCRQDSYSYQNDKVKGMSTKLPSFSFELELTYPGDSYNETSLNLLGLGFIRCSDSSVDDEYKSYIYKDCKSFSHAVSFIEKKLQDCVVSSHLHVGMKHRKRLQNHYSDVFRPLVDEMYANDRETIEIWGRRTNHWADFSSPNDRYNWVNFKSNFETLEFRLCKFQNAKQYRNLVLFCRTLVAKFDSEFGGPHSDEYYQQLGQWVLAEYHNLTERKGKYNV